VTTNPNDGRMDYIEFPATDIAKTKAFYIQVFGWKFTDYGPDYTSFEDGRIAGGFAKERQVDATFEDGQVPGGLANRPVAKGGPLVVIYATDLVAREAQVKAAGGKIVKDAFDFPGGRRFHFADPSGNELAVWSEK
jgi:predicted enzyme related to lactoylglutathione lyase